MLQFTFLFFLNETDHKFLEQRGRGGEACKDNHIHRLIIGTRQKKNNPCKYITSTKSSGNVERQRSSDDGFVLDEVYLCFRLNRGFRVRRYGEASSQFFFLTYDADNP